MPISAKLIRMTQVLSAEGQRVVEGRSRGDGKRSTNHWEPVIMGGVRGAGVWDRRGGRPLSDAEHELVMLLAIDWLHATGDKPKPGRSDNTGFGDLAHSVFQWLRLPEGRATYALRRYWTDERRSQTRPSLEDFQKRHDEEL